MRETLDRLLAMVTDEDLETLRDAILREEGRRSTQFRLSVKMPFPPLDVTSDDRASLISRWARLLAWIAHDHKIPSASERRGVAMHITTPREIADPGATTIMLEEALVEAGLLLGRTPEWMTATTLELESGETEVVRIDLWDRVLADVSWS